MNRWKNDENVDVQVFYFFFEKKIFYFFKFLFKLVRKRNLAKISLVLWLKRLTLIKNKKVQVCVASLLVDFYFDHFFFVAKQKQSPPTLEDNIAAAVAVQENVAASEPDLIDSMPFKVSIFFLIFVY